MIKSIKKKSKSNSSNTTGASITNTYLNVCNSITSGSNLTVARSSGYAFSPYITTTGSTTTGSTKIYSSNIYTMQTNCEITLLDTKFELPTYTIEIAYWINLINFHGIEFYASMKSSNIQFPYEDVNKFLDARLVCHIRNQKIKKTLDTDDIT